MSDTTGIEWTDRTYNPWIGCAKVSEGCKHCYAETLALQRKWVPSWGKKEERMVTKTALDPEKWNQEAAEAKTRYTVFCASLSDVFDEHPQVVHLRKDLWQLVKRTPFLDWMILTKRAQNISRMLPEDWGQGYPNVCLMVSVESQEYFDSRVPILRGIPAQHRALSVEPLIGHVTMPADSLEGINLVIVGGESGKGSRPMNPEWVRHLRDDCAREKVPFFFKQWGNWSPDKQFAEADCSNAAIFESYEATPRLLSKVADVEERKHLVKEFKSQVVYEAASKKGTGAKLDGKEHKEHPFLYNRGSKSTAPALKPLVASEKEELKGLEAIVSKGFDGFWEAGKALRQIRNKKLYRDTHTTFEDYCLATWEISRAEAYRQIGAAAVMDDLTLEGTPEKLPLTLSQTRPLLRLKTPSDRRKAWGSVSDDGADITAQAVEDAVRDLLPAPVKRAAKAEPVVTEQQSKHPVRDNILQLVQHLKDGLKTKTPEELRRIVTKLEKAMQGVGN